MCRQANGKCRPSRISHFVAWNCAAERLDCGAWRCRATAGGCVPGAGDECAAYDPYLASAPDDVMLVSLETLMATSDFVCVHVPMTEETDGMLNADMLGLMRPHAYLVSASDAAVFDQEALVVALRERRIAGAALDVFESHPVSPQNPLLAMDNVILSPHIGGATSETIQRHSQMMTDDILRFVRGEKPVESRQS